MGAGESPMMDSAYSLTPEEIAAAVEACGEKPWRAAQVCQWLYGGRAERWDAMANVPAALRQALSARLRVHEENTRAIAELLDGHPAVRRLYWPGLASHPGHEIAARQQQGFGAMLSFELADETAVEAFVEGLQCLNWHQA